MNLDRRRPGAPAGDESRNPCAGDDMVAEGFRDRVGVNIAGACQGMLVRSLDSPSEEVADALVKKSARHGRVDVGSEPQTGR